MEDLLLKTVENLLLETKEIYCKSKATKVLVLACLKSRKFSDSYLLQFCYNKLCAKLLIFASRNSVLNRSMCEGGGPDQRACICSPNGYLEKWEITFIVDTASPHHSLCTLGHQHSGETDA